MELNKRKSSVKKTIANEEGSKVLQRIPEIQTFLEFSNLRLKTDEFYHSANENLQRALDGARKLDDKYIYGLARFLTDNGLKLSPVLLYSILSEKGYSFRGKDKVLETFNTPQRIAEAISLVDNKYVTRLNNSFKEHILRKALEDMGEHTLKKNKLNNRKIKTKDLIKLLRPHPKTEAISTLYKAIIEDSKLSKLGKDSFVSVKSNKDLTPVEKKKYFKENLDKMPLNELIRNLRFITDNYSFKEEVALKAKVIKRLQGIDNYRFLNIFDLIEASIHVPQLESTLFEVIKGFVDEIKEKFKYDESGIALFDVSGSMAGKGEELGFKYVVLITLLFNDLKVYTFGNTLHSPDPKMVSLILKGKISDASKLYEHHNEGTALLQSLKEVIDIESEHKNFVVISDEVSWKEGEDLTRIIRGMPKDKKYILINPTISVGTVFDNNIVGIGSISSTILYNLVVGTDQKSFIKMIKEYT